MYKIIEAKGKHVMKTLNIKSIVVIFTLVTLGSLCNVKAMEKNSSKQLFDAIKQGNREKVKELIIRGTDINIQNPQGNTPLHMTIEYQQPLITKMLLYNKYGEDAKLDIKNNAGFPPLF